MIMQWCRVIVMIIKEEYVLVGRFTVFCLNSATLYVGW